MKRSVIEQIKKLFNKVRRVKYILIVFAILFVAASLVHFIKLDWTSFFHSEEGKVTTVSEAELRKVLKISELSTVDFTYNGVVTAEEEDGTEKYHVCYNGKVKAGIDFDKVAFKIEENRIDIVIPEVEILDCIVEPGKLDYIFADDKYDVDTTSAEAYKLCEEDLEKSAAKEEELLKMAKENAKVALDALFRPWIEQVYENYEVRVE